MVSPILHSNRPDHLMIYLNSHKISLKWECLNHEKELENYPTHFDKVLPFIAIICSSDVLNLLHLNTGNVFCMHVLKIPWALKFGHMQNAFDVFIWNRLSTPTEHINFLSPFLETFIQTFVVVSWTNIFRNPKGLG